MTRFSVADHIFELAMGAMCRPVPVPRNFRPFVTSEEGEPLFRVVLDAVVEPRKDEPLQTIDYELQAGDCTLRIYADEYRLTIRSTGEATTLVCPFVGEEGEVAEYSTDLFAVGKAPNSVMFDHALCFAYSFATLSHKTLLVHSSVIVKDGRAVMCLGESGTGKSTHTRLWLENVEGTERLNDDGPVVRVFDDGRVRVYGSPWSGKGAVYRQESCPIAGFLRLSQAPENKIQRLSRIGAFGALLPSMLPTLQKEERTLDRICGTLSEIIVAVPVYALSCLPDADAARLSYTTIFEV